MIQVGPQPNPLCIALVILGNAVQRIAAGTSGVLVGLYLLIWRIKDHRLVQA